MERWYAKLGLCLLPLALVPLVFFSLAEGWVSFGGGEKDIILAFPYTVWALVYTVTFVVMWVRRNPTKACAVRGAIVATIPLGLGWVGLLIMSFFAF